MSKTPSLGTGEAMPISQNIELTIKGIGYCEAQRRLQNRTQIVTILNAACDVMDQCIALLDRMEGDADFEIDSDDEANVQPLTLNREGTE